MSFQILLHRQYVYNVCLFITYNINIIDVGLLGTIRLINDGFNLLNLTVLATVMEYCVSDAISSRNKVAFV